MPRTPYSTSKVRPKPFNRYLHFLTEDSNLTKVALVAFADVIGFEFVGEVNGVITLHINCPAPWLGQNFAGYNRRRHFRHQLSPRTSSPSPIIIIIITITITIITITIIIIIIIVIISIVVVIAFTHLQTTPCPTTASLSPSPSSTN
jgi:hypothetical protein